MFYMIYKYCNLVYVAGPFFLLYLNKLQDDNSQLLVLHYSTRGKSLTVAKP